MKIFLLIVVFLFAQPFLSAQTHPRHVVSCSYYGELIKHPGIAIGLSQNLIKDNKKAAELKHLFQAGLQLGYYTHRKSHFTIFITPQLTYQYLFKKGLSLRLNMNVGYMRQFNYGTTYQVLSDNSVKKIQFAGRNKLITSLSIGLGRNLVKKKNVAWGWHCDLGVFTESPTNTGYLPHLFIKTGVDYFMNLKKRKL